MLIFRALVVFLVVPSLLEGCGRRPAQSRVVNGNDALPHSWPWMASVHYKDRGHLCGGVLITPEWVLTAAHCTDFNDGVSSYTVVVGAHHRVGSPTAVQESLKVKNLYYHINFRAYHGKHDVALLQLERAVKLSDKVNTVCLPKNGTEVKPGTECYITGWGRTVGGGQHADVLQEAKMKVVDYKTCKDTYINIISRQIDRQSMLCAGGQGTSGCNSDSGGPLVCPEGGTWVVRGVVSWGHPGCLTNYYSIFTRVSSHLKWINNIMTKGKDCLDHFDYCPDYKDQCDMWYVKEECAETCQSCD